MLTKKQLQESYGMSDAELAELDVSAQAYDEGKWPTGKVVRVGRPSTYDKDELLNLTFRIRKSRIPLIDEATASLGESRSEFLRKAIDEKLDRVASA